MDNMTFCSHSDMPKVHTVNTCIVCMEKFKNQENVHLTNECQHMFHTDCLEGWYKMVGHTTELPCPYCNAINRPYEYKGELFEEDEAQESENDSDSQDGASKIW
mmetsp:Transcript_18337/g.16214  ORF Transcript_18337/g.16214 Transcript_18337/m.16214 type:complete len:104 (+) Transcript_18337:855-1166(+)